jgi:hypothetical protein
MDDNQTRLTSYGRIDGLLIELSQEMSGWRLIVRHRHQAGLFGDCDWDEYTSMTMGEVLDVIDATVFAVPAGCRQRRTRF